VASAGTVLVVHGSGFVSSNGIVLARFNGQAAPTNCPAENLCHVTVPQLAGSPPKISLTISTKSGTSNALLVSYR
jgi:hypothetical protein